MKTLVESFLRASGYVNIEERHGGFRAEMVTPGFQVAFYIWPMPEAPDGSRKSWPAQLALDNIRRAKEEEPNAHRIFIRDEKHFTAEWLQKARDLGVEIRYPVQFFDRDFRFESGGDTGSLKATSRSLARNRRRARVPQPYTVEEGSSEGGEDLLQHLEAELSTTSATEHPETEKRLHIVIGPAGAGKSYLFETLFASLYERFHDRKRQQLNARRPFQLTPEHSTLPIVRGAYSYGFDAVFSDYLSNEFDSKTDKQAFTWRIQNGFGVWMLDGLDEVIASDQFFFDILLNVLVDTKESWHVPKVLICLRESMLNTNRHLQDFLDTIGDDVPHSIYRLAEWDETSVAEFLRLFAPDADLADRFRTISRQPNLSALTKNPFYCSQLLERLKDADAPTITADDSAGVVAELLDSFIENYLQRDRDKGLVDPRIPHEALIHALEMLAEENYQKGYIGVSVENLVELIDLVLPPGMHDDEDEYVRQIDNLKRLAFFSSGSENSDNGASSVRSIAAPLQQIHFGSDVIADYLFSRYARDQVGRLEQLVKTLSTGPALPRDGIVLSQVAAELDSAQVDELLRTVAVQAATNHSPGPNAVKNLLNLALLGRRRGIEPRRLLQNNGVTLRGQMLQSMHFEELDLSGMDFEGADLSNATFSDCDLTEARLDARLHNTLFEGELTIRTVALADFGLFGRFQSAVINQQTLDRETFREFLVEASEEAARSQVPSYCKALEELWGLVGRYKNQDGQPRRDWHHGRTILTRGRRHMRDREPLIDELVRLNYLSHDPRRDHYSLQTRAHADFAKFAVNRADLPAGLREILNNVCETEGCEHTAA
jgi:hypothetical protein